MNKSDKFRELLEKEEYLQNQLSNCAIAQFQMLRKAFKCLGLKLGYIPEMYDDQSVVKVAETTKWSVRYYRNTGIQIETHEISFEDLFDTVLEDTRDFVTRRCPNCPLVEEAEEVQE